MKKAMNGFRMRSLMAAFFLFGALLFGAATVSAQATTSDVLDWKTTPEAMQVLDAQIGQLAIDISGLTPGTAPYENASNHLTYYKLVYGSLEEGMSMPEAVNGNLPLVGISQTDDSAQGQAVYTQLLGDIVALLTN